MPLYEYKCDACGKRFEVIQKFSDAAPDACKHCGKGPVHRQMSSPAIQFKGSGFYITDYAKKTSGDGGASKTEGGKSDAGTGDGAKSEAKGDAGKSDAGKSDSGKGDAGKGDAGKSESAKSESSKTESSSKTETKSSSSSGPSKPSQP